MSPHNFYFIYLIHYIYVGLFRPIYFLFFYMSSALLLLCPPPHTHTLQNMFRRLWIEVYPPPPWNSVSPPPLLTIPGYGAAPPPPCKKSMSAIGYVGAYPGPILRLPGGGGYSPIRLH